MKNTISKIILITLFVFAGITHAQSSAGFSELIIGNWTGTGTLFGQEATFSMNWENELNNKFIKLTFENRFKDRSGVERVMNASAYYQLKDNKGLWFDSRGMMLPLTIEISDDTMTVLWGDENSERGKTIYTLINENELGVEDFFLKEDSYFPFGEASYQRLNK